MKKYNQFIKEEVDSTKEKSGEIIKRYPDGFYWIDAEINKNENVMVHGERSDAETTLLLWDANDDSDDNGPYVIIAVNYDEINIPTYSKIYQIKDGFHTPAGKPEKEYHKYIVDILTDDDIFIRPELDTDDEYKMSKNFDLFDLEDDELIKKLFRTYPKMFLNEPLFNASSDGIKRMFNKFPDVLKKTTDQYNLIKLFTLGLIDQNTMLNQMTNKLSDLVIKDGKIYMGLTSLSDLEFMFDSHRSRDHNYAEMFKSAAEGDWEYGYRDGTSLNDCQYQIDDINDENLKTIWDMCKKTEQSDVEIPEWEEFKKLRNRSKDFLVFLNEIDIEEINNAITNAVDDVQESADQDECHDACMAPVKEFFGIDRDKWFESNENYDYILLVPNLLEMIKWANDSKWGYPDTSIQRYVEAWFSGDVDGEENDKLEISVPYYGWNGTIDKASFNDRLSDKLSEI